VSPEEQLDQVRTKFRTARAMRGLTLTQVAMKAGVDKERVRQFELGAIPSSLTLTRIASALGMEIHAFTRGAL
jgi:transcriptional regulator with XRE-family HTH domain